jgi:hypothetical protein
MRVSPFSCHCRQAISCGDTLFLFLPSIFNTKCYSLPVNLPESFHRSESTPRPHAERGARQRPCLVFAPQRAAFEKSPGRLAFLSLPRRFSWGVCSGSLTLPPPPGSP